MRKRLQVVHLATCPYATLVALEPVTRRSMEISVKVIRTGPEEGADPQETYTRLAVPHVAARELEANYGNAACIFQIRGDSEGYAGRIVKVYRNEKEPAAWVVVKHSLEAAAAFMP